MPPGTVQGPNLNVIGPVRYSARAGLPLCAGRAAADYHVDFLYPGPQEKRCGTRCRASIPLAFPASSSLDDFVALFNDPYYLDSSWTTIKFSALVYRQRPAHFAVFRRAGRLCGAAARFYQTLMLLLPYAVAPAVAAVLLDLSLFNPGRGLITHFLGELGYDWNHAQNSGQAMFLVVFASVWKQISYNFLFFSPRCSRFRVRWLRPRHRRAPGRFVASLSSRCRVAPVSFFLLVVNLVYAFFDTFPVIDAATAGGPVQATTSPICKSIAKVSPRARSIRFRRAVRGADVPRHYPDRWCSSVALKVRCVTND